MTEDIVWEDPPEAALAKQPRGRYKEFAAALREHPQKWARLPGEKKTPESAKATALNIRTGKLMVFPKGQFEVVSEGLQIWVRFTGQEAPGQDVEPVAIPEQPEQPEQPSAVEADSGRGAMVRQWARGQGLDVAERGRLSQTLIDAFEASVRAGTARA